MRASSVDTASHSAAWRPTVPAGAIVRLARLAWAAARDDTPFDPDRLDRRDPAFIRALSADMREIATRWLNLAVDGTEHLTEEPCLYVANHSGGIMGPDLFCTLPTLWDRLGAEAPLYAMAHDFAMRRIHPLGRMLQRLGGMRASPANASKVLDGGGSVLVYPGGDLDAYRRFDRRHRVMFGTRTGFVRIAQRAGVPIVPIVAQGAHRSAIIVHEGEWLARALGLTKWSRIQRFPIALALPWGVAPGPWMPYLPMPFRIRLRILPPMAASTRHPPEHVQREVVARMQSAMDELACA